MVMVEMFVTVDAFEVELEVGVVALVQQKHPYVVCKSRFVRL